MTDRDATPTPAGALIRTGLVGFGLAGRVFHAPFLATNPEFSLDLIVTANPERAAEASRLHPDARVALSADELFAASETLDLVVIASPPATHVELANAALDAGLAVVVDKPFAPTAAEGTALVEKSERLGLALTVFQNRRWDGDFLTVRSLLADGTLGDVHRFESRFEFWRPLDANAVQKKRWKAEATVAQGGGILYDLGAHLIDQAIVLFGPVDDVYAQVTTRGEGSAADNDSFVALRHASGVTSHLSMNGLAAQAGPRFHVLGSQSAYTTWGLDGQEKALKSGALPTDPGFGETPEAEWGKAGIDGSLVAMPTERGRYDQFYAGLADALIRGASVPVDPRDAVRVIDLIEKIHASS
ncbi:Gfo/Idh/MocA family protein [Glaciibacter superstes]|uniref:Gfo/Idh/MocA family protein n=1 Tax=Glaciibacter superstes TaxID=501023 RepID=UPI0003B4F099|nr:Gfo/Idh/MocA family oxidoreductase [Glaciibacter superstes]